MKTRRDGFGFTLVELLVTMTLLALVTGISTLMLRQVVNVKGRVDEGYDLQQQARHAIEMVSNSLMNVARFPQRRQWVLQGVDGEWEGLNDDEVTYFGVVHQQVRYGYAESDVKEVHFRIERREETEETPAMGALVLRLDPTLNEEPDEGGVEMVVAKNIVGLNVEYHDGVDWVHDWEVDQGLKYPQLMRVTVTAEDSMKPRRRVTLTRLVNLPWMKDLEWKQPKKKKRGKGQGNQRRGNRRRGGRA
ncbi:type II secretion system protein [Planctomycetota bacterium]|nr:type II secretion system protein [Planctomycetota bacterium]